MKVPSLKTILAQEGLLKHASIPQAVEDMLTSHGRYRILSQKGGNFLTDGGREWGSGKFAAWALGPDLEKVAADIESAREHGKRYVPIMKVFPDKAAAMEWLSWQ